MFLGFLSLVFVFPPPVLFCGFARFTRRPSQWLDLRQARGARRPAPRPSEGQGSPSEGGGLVPSCSRISLPYFVWQRVTGTLGRTASRAFCWGGGVFVCPLRLFFTRTFFVPAPCCVFGLRGLRMPWRARSRARVE